MLSERFEMPSGSSRRWVTRVPPLGSGSSSKDQMVRFSAIRNAKSRCGSKRTTLPLVGQKHQPLAVEVGEPGALLHRRHP